MGRTKQTRKQIKGQMKTIAKHLRKIQEEVPRPTPDVGYIRKLEKEIDVAREKIRRLEKRLGR